MKRGLLAVCLLLFPSSAFAQSPSTKLPSQKANQPRFEIRVKPFIDLHFYVYKLASGDNKLPDIDGFAQAVEAARQVPMYQTLIDLLLFNCENAADAERVFAQFPETFKLRQGNVIPLREKAVRLARSLAVIEKPFLEKVWPQHRDAIRKAAASVAQTLGPKEQECFAYLTGRLGLEAANYVVPVYFVAEMPWPSALTAIGKESGHGACVVNVGARQGASLFDSILHEAIHALDAETRGEGNVLIEFQNQLLKNGFDQNDLVVRHAPHFLVFIQSVETVRRFLDASYQPYDEGVFVRPGLQPMVSIERPIWTAYLDGKFSREEALKQMVAAFVKAREKEAGE
ncbi:MAG TPA: hypothetical protein VHE60_17900 [Pyrinomonadaceae bacterium]|nr:hypothetical protein [Pyrinomonadaceae bacterium]